MKLTNSEYFYTKVQIVDEDEEAIKKKRCKISLRDIRQMYETYDRDRKDCIIIEYHNDCMTTLYDDFERIDKLHEKYLNESAEKGKEKKAD